MPENPEAMGAAPKNTYALSYGVVAVGAFLIAAAAGSAFLVHGVIKENSIGSAQYNQIKINSDLLTDLAPPALVPYQAIIAVHSLKDLPKEARAKYLDDIKGYEGTFRERLAYWKSRSEFNSEPETLALIAEIDKKGGALLGFLNSKVVPTILSDSPEADQAIADLTLQAWDLSAYAEKSTKILSDRNKELEQQSIARSESGLRVSNLVGICLTIFAIALVLVARRFVIAAISRVSEAMSQLASGNLEVDIPFKGRKDEIGQMVRSLDVFKSNAIENRAAYSENEKVVHHLSLALEKLSEGNLSTSIEQSFHGRLDDIRTRFNSSIVALRETISTVKNGTDGIRSGTEEIASASDDLSRRTESQAANLEQTAAAVAEITNKVKQTASGAAHARTVVETAKSQADRSGEIVSLAVEAMRKIEQSSQKITQIIGVIDEIAFQTNLLALNAGVEAARAGDAGRGFAVVASEVRALAQRSADAAKEIKQLLSDSQSAVQEGVGLVSQTGDSLHTIISRVAEINSIVGEIAANAEQQATGLQQVNTAVDQMDQVTQQNASMVQQTTAATRVLTQQSAELARLVARFTVAAAANHASVTRKSEVTPTSTHFPKHDRQQALASVKPVHTPAPRVLRAASGGAASPADEWTEF